MRITNKKKSILITGATSGIGLEAAKHLLNANHRLFMPCRNQSRIDSVKEIFNNNGFPFKHFISNHFPNNVSWSLPFLIDLSEP